MSKLLVNNKHVSIVFFFFFSLGIGNNRYLSSSKKKLKLLIEATCNSDSL